MIDDIPRCDVILSVVKNLNGSEKIEVKGNKGII